MKQPSLRYLIFESAEYHPLAILKTAALPLILAFSILVDIGAIPISNPWLATAVAFVTVWVVPGYLLSGLIFGKREMSWPERLPISFVLGVAVLGPLAMLLLILHSSLEVLVWISVVINVFLGGLYILLWKKNAGDIDLAQDIQDDYNLNFFLLGAFLLSIIAAIYLFSSTASTWTSGDMWYLWNIRQYLDTSHFTNVDLRASWWVLQALMDRVAKVEPVDIFSFYLPPLLLVVSLLAFYSLARELFKNRNAALLATLLQVLYCFSSIDSHNWIGRGFFDRVIEDKFLIWLIILPIATLFMLKYLASGKKKHFLPLVLTIATLSLIHPMGLVQWGISFTSFAFVHVLLNRKQVKFIRVIAAFIPSLLFLFIPLVQRQTLAEGGVAFNYASGLDYQFLLSRSRLLIFSAVENRYIAHPYLIAHPLAVLAILLTPLLVQYLRRNIAVQFLFSNMVIPLLVLYNPITAPLLGKLITPWMLWRVSWLLPISLTLGFFLYKIIRQVQRSLGKFPFFTRRPRFLHIIPVVAIVLVAIPLSGHIVNGLGFLRERRERTMPQEERALLLYLRELAAPDSIVIARQAMGNYIPAFASSVHVVLTSYGGASPSAGEDVDRFYQARLVTDSVLDILKRWNTRYVIIEREHELAFQFGLLPSLVTRLYQNAEYELYEVLPNPGPNYVVTGNTHLVRGESDEAIAYYKEALKLGSEDALAHFGLAQVYQAEGDVSQAAAEYEKAIAAAPNDPWLHLYLAEAYVARGEMAEDSEAYREAVKAYRQAFDLAPDNSQIQDALVQAYLALGDQYFEQNLLSQVIAAYEKAIQLDPDNRQAYWKLAEVYETLGQLDQAVAVYAQVVARWPDRGDAHLRLGQTYEARGNVEQAVAEYKKAIDLDPALAGAYTRLGDLYENRDTPQEAIGLYRTAARKNPDAAWPHLELGKLYLNQGIAGTGDETN